MANRKIFSLLETLDSHQLRKFNDFVQSPYFNKHEQVALLWQQLYQLPIVSSSKWTDEQLYQLISKEKTYDSKRLNHLFSYLLDLLMQFLAQEEYTQQEFRGYQDTINFLQKEDLDELQLASMLRKQQRVLARYPYQTADFYWHQHQRYSALDRQFLKSPSRKQDPNLQLKSNFLDYHYLYEKLKIACDMQNRNTIIKANYECKLLPEIKSHLQQEPSLLELPGIAIYLQILNMLETQAAKEYQKLKELLNLHTEEIPNEELQSMYDYAQNYCIKQINSGKSEYYWEFLELYKTQLNNRVLFRSGYLEEWDYKNIVTAGVRTGESTWTEQFIQQNKRYLKPEVRENAYTYNLANFYYETGRYAEALQQLHQVEFTDITYHLGAKNIQLKSFYELQEYTAFDALVRAFREYVRRNKQLSEYRRKAYRHFLNVAERLGRFREQFDYRSEAKLRKAHQKLESQLEELDPLANRDWLEKKFGELVN